jgi:hypothetical protein
LRRFKCFHNGIILIVNCYGKISKKNKINKHSGYLWKTPIVN